MTRHRLTALGLVAALLLPLGGTVRAAEKACCRGGASETCSYPSKQEPPATRRHHETGHGATDQDEAAERRAAADRHAHHAGHGEPVDRPAHGAGDTDRTHRQGARAGSCHRTAPEPEPAPILCRAHCTHHGDPLAVSPLRDDHRSPAVRLESRMTLPPRASLAAENVPALLAGVREPATPPPRPSA